MTFEFKYKWSWKRHTRFMLSKFSKRLLRNSALEKALALWKADQGRIEDFHWGGGGGGGRKILCVPIHITSVNPKVPYGRGPGPCYLSLIFKHSHTKWDKKNIHQSNFRGGGGHVAPPSKSATGDLLFEEVISGESGHSWHLVIGAGVWRHRLIPAVIKLIILKESSKEDISSFSKLY